jgi:two-component system LytT family response regulator
MKLTAVIVEDELKLRKVFVELLKDNCPEIEVIAEAANIIDGYALIIQKKPQVVFLDIEMPGGNGFELLAKFEKVPFETIFVSSYGHFAIRALRLSALDYLLKPVMIEDLQTLPARIIEAIDLKESALKYKILQQNLNDSEQQKKIILRSKTKSESLNLKDIQYLNSDLNYTTIYTHENERLVISKTLKEFEDTLCDNERSTFMRIHKTYIVNLDYVKSIERGAECFVILKDNTRLEVSRRKKAVLLEKFESLKK